MELHVLCLFTVIAKHRIVIPIVILLFFVIFMLIHDLGYPYDTRLFTGMKKCSTEVSYTGVGPSLNYYDLSTPNNANFKCVKTSTKPSNMICIYSMFEDMYISHDLEATGFWEPHLVDDFLNVLKKDETIGVIDIGANIGYYSLLAAKLGRYVLAVEPVIGNIQRLHKAAMLEGTQNKITVVQNAIADVRQTGTLRFSGDNQGDTRVSFEAKPCIGACPPKVDIVLLDDLAKAIHFHRAVMKIDVQGHEHRAFQHASLLFQTINISYVFMEWIVMRTYHNTSDEVLVNSMLQFFFNHDYRPFALSAHGGHPLDPKLWVNWPIDIVWHRMPNTAVKLKLLSNHFAKWPP